jgi:hypothetical protein
VRIWGNIISKGNTAFSVTPVMVGPVYIFSNEVYDLQNHWTGSTTVFKGGEGSTGDIFIYHNTFINSNRTEGIGTTRAYFFAMLGDPPANRNVYIKNNIIETDGPIVDGAYFQSPEFDYNLINNIWVQSYRNYWIEWNDVQKGSSANTNAENFNIWKAYTLGISNPQSVNGIAGSPTFTDNSTQDFTLVEGSLGIDVGVEIPGLNTAGCLLEFVGIAPDMGANEYTPSSGWATKGLNGLVDSGIESIMGILKTVISHAMGQ